MNEQRELEELFTFLCSKPITYTGKIKNLARDLIKAGYRKIDITEKEIDEIIKEFRKEYVEYTAAYNIPGGGDLQEADEVLQATPKDMEQFIRSIVSRLGKAEKCPVCKGKGVFEISGDEHSNDWVGCEDCDGTGIRKAEKPKVDHNASVFRGFKP